MENHVDWAISCTPTETPTSVILRKDSKMEMEPSTGSVTMNCLLAIGKEAYLMAQVSTSEKINMKVTFLMVLNLDLERKPFLMAINT